MEQRAGRRPFQTDCCPIPDFLKTSPALGTVGDAQEQPSHCAPPTVLCSRKPWKPCFLSAAASGFHVIAQLLSIILRLTCQANSISFLDFKSLPPHPHCLCMPERPDCVVSSTETSAGLFPNLVTVCSEQSCLTLEEHKHRE